MNYALIFAGGVGKRMNNEATPKQFMEVQGKPVLIHTIEHFDNHPQIDAICLVCVKDWLEYAKQLLQKNHIQKVAWLLPGGETALESQYIGLKAIYESEKCSPTDCVLIHDGVRPLINAKVISDCIETVQTCGAAVTVAPAVETIIKTDGAGLVESTISRSECMLARAPQAFRIGEIVKMHDRAIADENHAFIDSVSMMLHYGYKIKAVVGPAENIKVTTPTDFFACQALLEKQKQLMN